jgi:hypothetical protein
MGAASSARRAAPAAQAPTEPPLVNPRRMATRVRACLAHLALEGHRGPSLHASIEHTDGCAYLVLRRPGSGAAVSQMLLSGLELVDIGKGRVLIVPDLEPSELTLDGVGVLTLMDPEEFWDMVHRAGKTAASRAGIWDMLRRAGTATHSDKTAASRAEICDMLRRAGTATHSDIGSGELNSPRAPSTSAPAHRRQADSPRRLSAIPEVSRADAAGAEGTECAHARAAWSLQEQGDACQDDVRERLTSFHPRSRMAAPQGVQSRKRCAVHNAATAAEPASRRPSGSWPSDDIKVSLVPSVSLHLSLSLSLSHSISCPLVLARARALSLLCSSATSAG